MTSPTATKHSAMNGVAADTNASCIGIGEQDALQDIAIDPKEEAKLLAKLDLFLMPVIMLVYLSCFLDRSNIGNVKV